MIEMNLNFAAIIAQIGSGKNCQWVLNPWGIFNEKQDICMILSSCRLLISCKEKNNSPTEEKSDNTFIR